MEPDERHPIDMVASDLGQVMFLFNNDLAAAQFADLSLLAELGNELDRDSKSLIGARTAQVNRLLFEGLGRKYFDAFMRGYIDGEMYAHWIMNYLRLKPGVKPADVQRIFAKVFTRNKRATAMLKRWRRVGVRTVAASNMDPWRHMELEAAGLNEYFDRLCLSYQLQILKPARAFYFQVITDGQCTPRRTLFIDDKEVNVEAARACGLHGEVYDHRHHKEFLARIAATYRFITPSHGLVAAP